MGRPLQCSTECRVDRPLGTHLTAATTADTIITCEAAVVSKRVQSTFSGSPCHPVVLPAEVAPNRSAIHQPNFFPRLKVLHKLVLAGRWIVLDDVQYVPREWQNRCRLRFYSAPEHEFWLTASVTRPFGLSSKISEVSVSSPGELARRVTQSMRHAYRRSPHWGWISKYIDLCLTSIGPQLVVTCTRTITACLELLGLRIPFIQSSVLNADGNRSARLVALCKAASVSDYVSGSGSRSYLDTALFASEGITVTWQQWIAPTELLPGYRDPWRDYSFVDYVARFGPSALKDHLGLHSKG